MLVSACMVVYHFMFCEHRNTPSPPYGYHQGGQRDVWSFLLSSYTGFRFPGVGSERAAGMVPVRTGQGLPCARHSQFHLTPVKPVQHTAELSNKDGGTLGKLNLRKI